MMALLRLNLSCCAGLEQIDSDLWRACPQLEDLTACRVPNLRRILGFHEAVNLKRLRVPQCPNLRELQVPRQSTVVHVSHVENDGNCTWDHGACKDLVFSDFHGCLALPDEQIWDLIGCRLNLKYFEASELSSSSCVEDINKVIFMEPAEFKEEGYGTLRQGDVAKVVDFWSEADESIVEVAMNLNVCYLQLTKTAKDRLKSEVRRIMATSADVDESWVYVTLVPGSVTCTRVELEIRTLVDLHLQAAIEAVNEFSIQKQKRKVLDPEWMKSLEGSLEPLASSNAKLANVLKSFDWNGTHFTGEINLKLLLRALQALASADTAASVIKAINSKSSDVVKQVLKAAQSIQNCKMAARGELEVEFLVAETKDSDMIYLLKNQSTESSRVVKRGCHIRALEDGLGMETQALENKKKGLLVVWPSPARAESFPPLQRAGASGMILDGLRAKLRKAILICRTNSQASSLPEAVARQDMREELLDAIQRANGKVLEVPLLRSMFMEGCILDLAPDLKIECCLGCGQQMKAMEYLDHEKVCPKARRRCMGEFVVVPCVGKPSVTVSFTMGVAPDEIAHFNAVCRALTEALQGWNCEKLRDALTAVCGPQHNYWGKKKCQCHVCQFPHEVLRPMFLRLQNLEDKLRLIEPIMQKGRISVDFDTCSVHVLIAIQFAARKPPDTSAELERSTQAQSEETIRDLAAVIKAYLEPMVIEGHTGQTTPLEYWKELADNRSNLIANLLERFDVPKKLCIPHGCPGGGALVLVYPLADKKNAASSK
eukprot:gnl/MRDRNA2_/MRDRNA2_198838_c0_seq1.p1 gnl/MRDRNA2_/MRDRNA2_198838_c0~~gnl/MRDRNA2_/MRDRNA2_198838_c0_seq1.p1  ORF type:complete len:771 (+),score=139.65 gnl/MRDRNA2_/MRDRNA2_198838_c0_seq1:1-2313(+)